MTEMVVGHLVLFLTTVSGFVFQWMHESRRHKWEREKYEALKAQIKNGH